MFYVYILGSETAEEYIGFTKDLRNRLAEHNRGVVFSTKRYIPWQLIYHEAFLNERDARRREKYLKTSQGRRMLKRKLKEYLFEKKTNRISTTGYVG
ncbi:excinuclease ABC subunit C [bacterium]|nr:excinuclease ABC subunit C [bacterium]